VANQHVCVSFVIGKVASILLPGSGSVKAAYSTESFIPDPPNNLGCEGAAYRYNLEQSQRTADAVAAKSSPVTSAQSASPLENGLAAEKRGDWKAAFWLLIPLAEQGNPSAEAGIGYIFENNDSPLKDKEKAMEWFHKAADQGNADAQNGLGAMYYNGEGVTKDNTEAMKWFRKAADQGNADAQENIARLNKQVEQDKTIKINLAARKGIGDTVCYPSTCYADRCTIYGQVENVHNDKIEVRVHVPGSGYIGPYGGTVSAAHDELNWISYNEVIECGR
jgi:TPR repeat protein